MNNHRAPHIVHTPLQVPQHFLDKFAFMEQTDKPTHNRQIYHSMVNFADEAVGTAISKRKSLPQNNPNLPSLLVVR